MIIFNNNLFFSIAGQTLYINLENTNYLREYNRGILYSIQNGKLIYSYQNYIYKAEYYPSTLAISSVFTIASGSFSFMFEDNNNLYFYSINDDDSKSVFSINKDNQDVNVLDRFYLESSNKLNILSYIQSEDNIYLILERNEKSNKRYELKAIAKKDSSSKTIALGDKVEDFIYASKNNVFFKLNEKLFKYDFKTNEISEATEKENIRNIYELKVNSNNIALFKDNELFADILKGVENKISNEKIIELGNYLYFSFNLLDDKDSFKEYMFWRIKKDGTELERINNKI